MPLTVLTVAATAGALCACLYYLVCLWGARSYLRQGVPSLTELPPVSVLKPLKGADAGTYENLKSFCAQDYPGFEIICGVGDPQDEVIPTVERLAREFPERKVRLVVCPERLGANAKVSSLMQMLPHARYQHLLLSDADIHAPADYLRLVLSSFSLPGTAVVTCIYRGAAGHTLPSRLEALGINGEFIPAVLAARITEGVRFALGSTIAITREWLEKAGGFEGIRDHLADDYQLGARAAALGAKVALAPTVVQTQVPGYSWRQFLRHQLRWARTLRCSRPGSFTAMAFTFGLPWALLAVLASGGATWAWLLLAVTLTLRAAAALYVGGRVLGAGKQLARDLWLLPLRDLLSVFFWARAHTGRTIWWHGARFRLRDGKLQRA